MLLIYGSTVVGWVGLVSSLMMAITVVGFCRFGSSYQRFFDRLKRLGTLDTIKEMSRIYFSVLNSFLGKTVGIKQTGVVEKAKYFGLYIEHLLLVYWIGATILVLAFRPVEPAAESANSLEQAVAFVTLLSINILSDAASLLWTKRCMAIIAGMVPDDPLTTKRLIVVLAQDLGVAILLMLAVQLVSNGLYAVQIGRPDEFFKDMFDCMTAFKPYHPINPKFSGMHFPGQLVITLSTFVPSILFYLICLTILCLIPFYKALFFVLSIFNLKQTGESEAWNGAACSQLGYIGSLASVFGIAIGSASLIVFAWSLTPHT